MAMPGYIGGASDAVKMPSTSAPAMPTLASGVGQVTELNSRLSELHARVSGLVDTIGGPRPIAGEASNGVGASGIVNRLHDEARCAHGKVSDINDLLDTISRSLG